MIAADGGTDEPDPPVREMYPLTVDASFLHLLALARSSKWAMAYGRMPYGVACTTNQSSLRQQIYHLINRASRSEGMET
eukprot:scaffold46412_cov66-Cyclotella_meneghiniana.AAC.2